MFVYTINCLKSLNHFLLPFSWLNQVGSVYDLNLYYWCEYRFLSFCYSCVPIAPVYILNLPRFLTDEWQSYVLRLWMETSFPKTQHISIFFMLFTSGCCHYISNPGSKCSGHKSCIDINHAQYWTWLQHSMQRCHPTAVGTVYWWYQK